MSRSEPATTKGGASIAVPVASIIIPAHNEADTIGRCLSSILADAKPGEFEVIVACNGCTDPTADIARSFEGVVVVEEARPSKAVALNAGDAAASAFPRVYVDADIEMTTADVRELASALSGSAALAASPVPVFKTDDRPLLIRAFYRAWGRTPYLRNAMVGTGVYALSRSGRERFDSFPELFGDDYFVRGSFDRSERQSVATCSFVVRPPKRLRDLVAIRRRVYFGNHQMRSAAPAGFNGDDDGGASAKALLRSSSSALQVFDAIVYLTICAVAKTQVRRLRSKGQGVVWERDQSGRSSE